MRGCDIWSVNEGRMQRKVRTAPGKYVCKRRKWLDSSVVSTDTDPVDRGGGKHKCGA